MRSLRKVSLAYRPVTMGVVYYAARQNGVKCITACPNWFPKRNYGIKALGAEVHIVGRSQDDAQVEVDKLVNDGMTMIPPFDHPNIIAGQGTIGLELAEDLPDLTTALVQLSGGGRLPAWQRR